MIAFVGIALSGILVAATIGQCRCRLPAMKR
jgi:hypothetical protein